MLRLEFFLDESCFLPSLVDGFADLSTAFWVLAVPFLALEPMAGCTDAPTVATDDVFGVAAGAAGACGTERRRTDPTHYVLSWCDLFKMLGVHASTIPAKVIHAESGSQITFQS